MQLTSLDIKYQTIHRSNFRNMGAPYVWFWRKKIVTSIVEKILTSKNWHNFALGTEIGLFHWNHGEKVLHFAWNGEPRLFTSSYPRKPLFESMIKKFVCIYISLKSKPLYHIFCLNRFTQTTHEGQALGFITEKHGIYIKQVDPELLVDSLLIHFTFVNH